MFLSLNEIDILCISETRLKPFHILRNIPGYNIYRKNAKPDSHDRGVAILVKDNLKVEQVQNNIKESLNIEYLSIIVQYKFNKSFLVSCIYRHPNYLKTNLNTDYEFLEELFSDCTRSNKSIYILGDFNLRDDKSAAPLRKILKHFFFVPNN